MQKERLNIKVDKLQQILLCNTNRDISDYIKSINIRSNVPTSRKPNYIIDKKGKITLLNKDDVTQTYLKGYHTDSSVIVICLENRGWLKRRSNDGKFVDWLGDIYNSKVHEKKWRGKLFWDEYSDKHMKATIKLIKEVCHKNKIPNNFIGHNVLVEGIENFKGIVSRSNYNEYWTDVNPSFNFELL